MKIIVISNPTAVENEATRIRQLFDEGTELLHLRKPDYTETELEELLTQIGPEYYSKISLHQHHSLAAKFNMKRLHFSEEQRKKTSETELQKLKENGFILSTSIHDIQEHKDLSPCFDYTFYGPVFESISKSGYKPKQKFVPQLKKEERATKIIAIGGVDRAKIPLLENTNFDGAALLGAIWNVKQKETKIIHERT